MADPNTTKLPQLPWPALVGASLLLHVGALMVTLPAILRVDSPPGDDSHIPVTLVDAADQVPVAVANNSPAAVPPSAELAQEPAQSMPLNGQNPTAEPQVSNPTATPPQNRTPKQPQQDTSVNSQPPKTPVNTRPPDDSVPTPNNGSQSPVDTEAPGATTPEAPPPSDNQTPADEDPQSSGSGAGDGAVSVRIIGTPTVPLDTPGDWPDQLPVLQSTSMLSIAGNHPCNDAFPTDVVTLGLVIAEDGSVLDVFVPAGTGTASVQTAQCLLTHALRGNPAALQFSPAYTGQQAVITDRQQITLQFSPL